MTKLRERRQGRDSSARRGASGRCRTPRWSRHVIGSVSGSAQVPTAEAQVGCSRCVEDREHLRCEWRIQNVPRAQRCAEKVCAVPSCENCVDHHERGTVGCWRNRSATSRRGLLSASHQSPTLTATSASCCVPTVHRTRSTARAVPCRETKARTIRVTPPQHSHLGRVLSAPGSIEKSAAVGLMPLRRPEPAQRPCVRRATSATPPRARPSRAAPSPSAAS